MSLVQSIFNQIGREIGRDIYRGSKSLKGTSNSFEQSLLEEINSFELATYDKTTIKKLANLIAKTDQVNHRNFTFDEVFIELDSKIDFAKKHLDVSCQEQLEKLDKENNMNYLFKVSAHKVWIEKQMNELSEKLKNAKVEKLLPFIIKGPLVIISLLIFIFFIYNEGINSQSVFAFIFIMIFPLLLRYLKFRKKERGILEDCDRLEELTKYYTSISMESLNK